MDYYQNIIIKAPTVVHKNFDENDDRSELFSEIHFIHHKKDLEETISISISQLEILSHFLQRSINQNNEPQHIYTKIADLVFEQINTINLEDNRVDLLGSIEIDSETSIIVDIGITYKSEIISTRLTLIYNEI